MAKDEIPSCDELMQPTLTAFHKLGGIAGTFMIDEAVIEDLRLPREVIERTRSASDSRSEISYRLSWVRTRLKNYGLIENPQRGLWQLTSRGTRVKSIDPRAVDVHIRRDNS